MSDNPLQAEIDHLREQLKAASEEETYLECAKCGTCYEAEPGRDYSAGVFCPECKRLGYTLVGICHPVTTRKFITQKDWDELKAEAARLLALIIEHNTAAKKTCAMWQTEGYCATAGYKIQCSDCPREWEIDAALHAEPPQEQPK